MTEVIVRPARPEDADAIAEMANSLNVLMGEPDGRITGDILRRDVFDSGEEIEALVAEQNGGLVGYALFHDAYNTDLPAWGLWIMDLYVAPEARSQGVGRLLMAEVARETLRRGGRSLSWGVLNRNTRALEFYARLGAEDPEARILELTDEPLVALAAESPNGDRSGRTLRLSRPPGSSRPADAPARPPPRRRRR